MKKELKIHWQQNQLPVWNINLTPKLILDKLNIKKVKMHKWISKQTSETITNQNEQVLLHSCGKIALCMASKETVRKILIEVTQ